MSPNRILSGLLLTCLITLAAPPMVLAAEGACTVDAQASYEQAFIQAHGERFVDDACADVCLSNLTDAVASYQRAFIQAHSQPLDDAACVGGCPANRAETTASYERALIQAQDHVIVEPTFAQCGVTVA